MSAIRLTILGAGNVRCSPAVIGTLATFYGERPLEVFLYDADAARLSFFETYAQFCFFATHSMHTLKSSTDLAEATADCDKVIIQIDDHCARLMTGNEGLGAIDSALELIANVLPAGVDVMSLLLFREVPFNEYRTMDWPQPLTEAESLTVRFQLLRYLNKEDYLYEVLKAGKESPLRPWLDLPVRM